MHYRVQLPHMIVRWKYSGIAGGFSADDAPDAAARKFEQLRHAFGAATGTHMNFSADFAVRIAHRHDRGLPAAALITTLYGHSLLLRPADCIPLVLFDRTQPFLALCHCGRRELDSGVIERTLAEAKQRYAIAAGTLQAYIGPGIRQSSYRLPARVLAELHHPTWRHCIRHSGDDVYPDIFGFTIYELQRLGLFAAAITVSRVDTLTNRRYYSHYGATRRGQPPGYNSFAVVMQAVS